VAGLAATGEARADDLTEVRRLEATLEYEQALTLVDRMIAGGNATNLAELHFEAGKLAAGLGRAGVAEDHFLRALALDPTLAFPPGASPKLTTPFEAARAVSRPLQIKSHHAGLTVTVETEIDRSHLLAIAKVRFVDPAGHHQERSSTSGPPFEIQIPTDAWPIEIVATDEYGNVLYSVIDRGDVRPRGNATDGPWYGSWKIWAAGAGFAGGIAGLCAWRESVAQDDWNRLKADPAAHDYSQLRVVEDRGRSWALAANVGFGVAGAVAITGVIVYVTHRSEPAIAITAGPGTVGVAGRF
jgi:hypothetical protein